MIRSINKWAGELSVFARLFYPAIVAIFCGFFAYEKDFPCPAIAITSLVFAFTSKFIDSLALSGKEDIIKSHNHKIHCKYCKDKIELIISLSTQFKLKEINLLDSEYRQLETIIFACCSTCPKTANETFTKFKEGISATKVQLYCQCLNNGHIVNENEFLKELIAALSKVKIIVMENS